MSTLNMALSFAPFTAREILIMVAGPQHAEHSVVECDPVRANQITFRCSCGATCMTLATEDTVLSLRNVPMSSLPLPSRKK